MLPQISRTPDFKQKFWEKKCGLYAGFYGIMIDVCDSIFEGPGAEGVFIAVLAKIWKQRHKACSCGTDFF